MATINGSTSSSAWTYKLEVSEGTYSIENNTSPVTVTAYLGRASSQSYIGGTWSGSITVDGQSQSMSGTIPYPTYINAGAWYTLATKTFTVKHNDDGSKTASISSSWAPEAGVVPSSASAGGSVVLSTIPRATPCPSLSGYIGSSYNISFSPYVTSFRHSIQITLGSTSTWLQSDGSLGTSEYKFPSSNKSPLFTIPKSFYSEFTGKEKSGTILLRTYNSGGTKIGEKSNTFTARCNPDLCSPLFDVIVTDSNDITKSLTGNEHDLVLFASHALITPTIIASDEDDTNTTISSKSVNDILFTTDTVIVSRPSSNQFTVSVTNSRGFVSSKIVTNGGNVINYIPLTFNIVSLKRVEPTTGEIELEYNGNYFVGNFGNADNELEITWSYKLKNDDEYTYGGVLTPTIDTDKNTYSGKLVLSTIIDEEESTTVFDYTQQYDFIFYYKDKIVSSSLSGTVPRGFPIYWWDSNDVHFNGDIYISGVNPLLIYSEEEMLIGRMLIDGEIKNIYGKLVKFTPTEQRSYVYHNIENVDTIIDVKGICKRTDSVLQNPMPNNYSSWEIYFYDYNPTSCSLYFSDNQWNAGVDWCIAIFEYTKIETEIEEV